MPPGGLPTAVRGNKQVGAAFAFDLFCGHGGSAAIVFSDGAQLVTQRGTMSNKKGLHFCNPLILKLKLAPPAGLEPATH
jgi:hypothetical protein